MDLFELNLKMNNSLSKLYDSSEIESFFYILINFRLNLSKIDYVLNKEHKISNEDILFFEKTINRLKNEEPIQYILENTDFYGLKFHVNKNTLIPRPETEELVNWIIKDFETPNKENLSILDIGTGSGCIPISLSKNLKNSNVVTVDISQDAIDVAKHNAVTNSVTVSFVIDSILDPKIISCSEYMFDVIVSNPPYVRNLEKQEIKKNVLSYEPHLALFVEDSDPLIFYREIAKYAISHLKKNGVLYFEINQYLGRETVLLMKKMGFKNVELRKDISGNDRMIKAFDF